MPILRFIPLHPVPDVCGETRILALSPSHRNRRPPLHKGGEELSSRIQEKNEEPPMRDRDRSTPD